MPVHNLHNVGTMEKIDLAGQWNYELDYNDLGEKESWYSRILSLSNFQLPGTTAENEVGEPLEMELNLTKETVKSLRQKYRYVGAAWYQKKIHIPKQWLGKGVQLFLERVMFQSTIWVNGQKVGTEDSLSTPHVYDITNYVTPDKETTITIRIDNRDVQNIGPYPSAYTDETQTIWNGIVGKLELRSFELVHIGHVQITPNVKNHQVESLIEINNLLNSEVEASIDVEVISAEGNIIGAPVKVTDNFREGKNIVPIKNVVGNEVTYWDEFEANLYGLRVSVIDSNGNKEQKTIPFGMKEFKVADTQFEVNGRRIFLRGTLDCCIYPLTGYPPMDKQTWLEVFQVVKDYGLNHIRFHSWCPPEAAFSAADALGLYLNVEAPMWMDNWSDYPVGAFDSHYRYLPKEAIRILKEYGHHPSFCMFSNGNELNGDFDLLHNMIVLLKDIDPTKVYTLTSNWDRKVDSADDYFCAQTVDGVGIRGQYYLDEMVQGTMLDYKEGVSLRNMPVVSHEIGQYSVYPDMGEIQKYTGVLRPINFEVIKQDLIEKNMLKYSKDFTHNSGKLAANLYKEEVEAALRTQGFAGFQLLDIHDFPGQSTATVGLLNSFWESKGIISGEEFRKFCSETVPILRIDKRIYSNKEAISAKIEVSHYGPRDLPDATINWKLTDQLHVLASGNFKSTNIKSGEVTLIGLVENIHLDMIDKASQLSFIVEIEGTNYKNKWDIWVYPDVNVTVEDNVVITTVFNVETEKYLQDGRKVLLLPSSYGLEAISKGGFFPVFWSPIHFKSQDPCGITCNNTHPIFNEFPTDTFAHYQWKDLLENSFSIHIDELPVDFEPIVTVIPNFFNNSRMTNLFEATVGNGKLVVCSMDISNDLHERIAAKQLKNSILHYMQSDKFSPTQQLRIEELRNVLAPKKRGGVDDTRVDLALNKKAIATSEKSLSFSAKKGNDGNITTYWSAADASTGHWWQVDLEKVYEISGTRVTFSEAENYLYVIKVSEDGENWRLVVNQTGKSSKQTVMDDVFEAKARYVRIVYTGLPSGIWASHKEFQVFLKE
ncbi:discoidin domain-containing protein [Lederbergia graminis]|uniref:Discoidin domain-containing protein n=1 Tax=Lederbergia graminis TaxID=735518 RepID=A0ABW0LHL7_9BACI